MITADSLIRNGNIELVEKEEEIRYLKMEVSTFLAI